jgi:hypothetical protein
VVVGSATALPTRSTLGRGDAQSFGFTIGAAAGVQTRPVVHALAVRTATWSAPASSTLSSAGGETAAPRRLRAWRRGRRFGVAPRELEVQDVPSSSCPVGAEEPGKLEEISGRHL